jgi:hypothetical protein
MAPHGIEKGNLEGSRETRLALRMKKAACWTLSLALAGWALSGNAQTVWTYEVIRADNNATVASRPPMDISYPASNASVPVYYRNDRHEIELTAQEAAARLRAPKLIILLAPSAIR